MTTRAELRATIRRRLEDTGASPLWDDATLNDGIADGLRRYGARLPAQRSATVAVAAGAQAVTPVGVPSGVRLLRVEDAEGEPVPRARADVADAGATAQGWRWWGGQLLLSQPAAGGTWRVEYLGPRTLPPDDAAALDLDDGDEEILTLLAVTAALRRRATEDAKRGDGRTAAALLTLAEAHERWAEAGLAARRRRARGSWVDGGG